jgi:hypothetical protein
LPFCCVDARHDAGYAEREELAVVVERRRLRPLAMGGGTGHDLVRRGIARLPDHLAAVGIDCADQFVAIAPRQREDAVADQDRRRVAFADLDLPARCQPLGPIGRRDEPARRAIALPPAPLRVVGIRFLAGGCCHTPQQQRHRRERSQMSHQHEI